MGGGEGLNRMGVGRWGGGEGLGCVAGCEVRGEGG